MADGTYSLTLTPHGSISKGGHDRYDVTGTLAGAAYVNRGTFAVQGAGLWLSVRSFATARGGSPASASAALSAAIKALPKV